MEEHRRLCGADPKHRAEPIAACEAHILFTTIEIPMDIRPTLKGGIHRHPLQAFFHLHHKYLQARARDVTEQSRSRSGLVLAPHPDDEALGCGITVMQKVAFGAKVAVVFATDGRHSYRSKTIPPQDLAILRRQEALTSCRILGLPEGAVTFLDYEDGSLARHMDTLIDEVRQLVLRYRPEEIFVSSAIDAHPDHRALNAATRHAVKISGHRPVIYEYPIWFWAPRAWVDPEAPFLKAALQVAFRPFIASVALRPVTISGPEYLSRKRAAIYAHRSQTANLTGEPGWRILDQRMLGRLLSPKEMFFLRIEGASGQ